MEDKTTYLILSVLAIYIWNHLPLCIHVSALEKVTYPGQRNMSFIEANWKNDADNYSLITFS